MGQRTLILKTQLIPNFFISEVYILVAIFDLFQMSVFRNDQPSMGFSLQINLQNIPSKECF